MQAKSKKQVINKRQPSMQLPSPVGATASMRANNNIMPLNSLNSRSSLPSNTLRNAKQSLSKKTLDAYNGGPRIGKYTREQLIYSGKHI